MKNFMLLYLGQVGTDVTQGVLHSGCSLPDVHEGIGVHGLGQDGSAKKPPYLWIWELQVGNGGVSLWISWDSISRSLLVSGSLKPSLVHEKLDGPWELSPYRLRSSRAWLAAATTSTGSGVFAWRELYEALFLEGSTSLPSRVLLDFGATWGAPCPWTFLSVWIFGGPPRRDDEGRRPSGVLRRSSSSQRGLLYCSSWIRLRVPEGSIASKSLGLTALGEVGKHF